MTTYRQLIYIVLDELKISTDDSYFTEDHIAFLLNKYRSLLLKQLYKDVKKEIPESNFQTICLDLKEVPAIPEIPCEGGSYLRSTEKIPNMMTIAKPKITTENQFQTDITLVSKDRFKYVGNNKWLQNIIYSTLGSDNYLYLKSSNPQYLYLEKVQVSGVFEDPEQATELRCDKDEVCDPWDSNFPLEEGLIPQLIKLIIQDLAGVRIIPEDKDNDSNDSSTTQQKVVKNG